MSANIGEILMKFLERVDGMVNHNRFDFDGDSDEDAVTGTFKRNLKCRGMVAILRFFWRLTPELSTNSCEVFEGWMSQLATVCMLAG